MHDKAPKRNATAMHSSLQKITTTENDTVDTLMREAAELVITPKKEEMPTQQERKKGSVAKLSKKELLIAKKVKKLLE
jgi:hypothetical protein